MESSFYRAYAHNKDFIDKVKERNAYAYSVASFVDDLYLDGEERKKNKTQHEKLQEAYYTLVKGVKEEFLPYITNLCSQRGWTWKIQTNGRMKKQGKLVRLNGFIEYNVAVNYIEEVKYCASSLLLPIDKYLVFRDYQNDFEGANVTKLKETCRVDFKTNNYYCLANSVVKHATAEHPAKKYDKNRNYGKYRDSSIDMMALTVFSLYFSGKHDGIVNAKGSKYKEAMATFHYTLKNLQGQPEFNENTQDDLNKILTNHAYKDLFKKGTKDAKDDFIQDYEDLDVVAKFCAFTWKEDKTKHLDKFKTLIPKKESFEFYYEKTQKQPVELAIQLLTKLKNTDLKDLLSKYMKITKEDKSLDTTDTLLNMAYSLSASRTKFDLEATQISAFNTGSALGEFVKELSFKLQGLETSTHESLYEKPIFKLYHENLHALITHALVEGEFNAGDFTNRKANANKLLTAVAPDTQKKYEEDLKELNDGNLADDLKIKTEHEQLFEKLKALDGITSQIHGAEEKKNAPGSKKTDQAYTKLRNTKSYKTSISGLKGLSFFVTLFNTGEALKTFNKHDLKSLLDVTTGINSLSKTVANTTAKGLSKTARATQMIEFLFKEEALPQKMLAKLAIPAIVVGAYYQIEALDDEDYDAMIAISAKAALVIALGFVTGIGIALVAAIALELIWMYVSSFFIDTRTEVLVEKSLFYQGSKRTPYILESLSVGNKTYVFDDKPTKIKKIERLGGLKATRDFIYNNYKEHKQEFQAAVSYEFSSIFRALQNIEVKVYKKPTYYTSRDIKLNFNGNIMVNKDYYKQINNVYLIQNDNYEDNAIIDYSTTVDFKEDDENMGKKNKLINIFTPFQPIIMTKLSEASKDIYTVLIDSGATSVKYKLDISYYKGRTYWVKNQLISDYNFYLDDLVSMPLTNDDIQLLKT